jgi:hypothetical protein
LETPHKGFNAKPFTSAKGFQQQKLAYRLW